VMLVVRMMAITHVMIWGAFWSTVVLLPFW
jgi:hypothetical protein